MGQRMRPTDGGPAARSRVSGAGTSVDDEIAAIERNGDGLSRVGPLGLFLAVVAGAAAVYLTLHRFLWYADIDAQTVAVLVPIALASIATRMRPVIAGSSTSGWVALVTTQPIVLALLLVWGPAPAMTVMAIATITKNLQIRSTPGRLAVDTSQWLVSISATAYVLVIDDWYDATSAEARFVAASKAAAFLVVLNHLIASGIAAGQTQSRWLTHLTRNIGPQAAGTGILYCLTPVMTVGLMNAPLSVPVLAVPLVAAGVMTRQSYRREQEATTDTLTQLPNRLAWDRRLNDESRKDTYGVLMIDLNKFKAVNDTYGHATGDLLLRAFAERLTAQVRPEDTAARLSGDEFCVLMPGMSNEKDLEGAAHRLRERLGGAYQVGDVTVHVSAAVGWTLAGAGTDPSGVMAAADSGMYAGKPKRGRHDPP